MNIPHEVVYIFLTTLIAIQTYMLKEIISMKVSIARLFERVQLKDADAGNNVVPMRGLRK